MFFRRYRLARSRKWHLGGVAMRFGQLGQLSVRLSAFLILLMLFAPAVPVASAQQTNAEQLVTLYVNSGSGFILACGYSDPEQLPSWGSFSFENGSAIGMLFKWDFVPCQSDWPGGPGPSGWAVTVPMSPELAEIQLPGEWPLAVDRAAAEIGWITTEKGWKHLREVVEAPIAVLHPGQGVVVKVPFGGRVGVQLVPDIYGLYEVSTNGSIHYLCDGWPCPGKAAQAAAAMEPQGSSLQWTTGKVFYVSIDNDSDSEWLWVSFRLVKPVRLNPTFLPLLLGGNSGKPPYPPKP